MASSMCLNVLRTILILSRSSGGKRTIFCAVNYRTSDPVKFSVNGNLGENSFRRYIQDACQKTEVIGEGVVDHVVLHGLRGTVVTRLFETGFFDASIALRSEHRAFRSFKWYHNLRRALRRQQQAAVLGSFSGETTNVSATRVTFKTLKENVKKVAIREEKRQKNCTHSGR